MDKKADLTEQVGTGWNRLEHVWRGVDSTEGPKYGSLGSHLGDSLPTFIVFVA